jgi:hypothetical protein
VSHKSLVIVRKGCHSQNVHPLGRETNVTVQTPLARTTNTTGQQHWPPPLVSTTGRHHWPGPLATCSKHIDDDDDDDIDDAYDDVYDYDDYDDAGAGAGDGDGELTIHSIMCVHECARSGTDLPSWPTNWTATLGSTTGHNHWPAYHHWPAALAATAGQHHRPASLARTPGNMFQTRRR